MPSTTDRDLAEHWHHQMQPAGLEGLVLKRTDQCYPAGCRDWLKLRNRMNLQLLQHSVDRQLTVVAGQMGIVAAMPRTRRR